MAANSTESNGRKNYYGIAYGYLSTRTKQLNPDFKEMTEAELKSNLDKFVAMDLRKAYVNKGGDYPYQVFYQSVDGEILSIEKRKHEKNGMFFDITVNDKDNEESIVNCKFYSKYTENFLNRLLNLKEVKNITIAPYSIINDSEDKKQKFYNQGVSLRTLDFITDKRVKVDGRYDSKWMNENHPTEKITDADGKEKTSRVKRIEWLFEQAQAYLKSFGKKNEHAKSEAVQQKETPVTPQDESDLPFVILLLVSLTAFLPL
ncbi:MAG: hypothetical protein WAS34_18945 [Thiolinea sp.]